MIKVCANLLFIFFIFSPNHLLAQNSNDSTIAGTTVSNIIDMSDKLNVHFYGKQKMTSFNFYDVDQKRLMVYRPNSNFNIGIGFNYQFFGLGIALNFKFINDDDDLYGVTKRLDMQMNAYGKKSVIDLTLFAYKSFYIENPNDVFPAYKQQQGNYIRPDIHSFSMGVSYLYIFNNKNFSYKSAFINNAIQKHSAGSFFMGPQLMFLAVSGDSSFFPSNSYFDSLPALKSVSRLSMGILSGYAYNIIIHHDYYISLSLTIAQDFGKQSYSIGDKFYVRKWVPAFDLLPRFAIGYNGTKYYGGFSGVVKVTAINAMQNDAGINMGYKFGNFRFFIGRRFNMKRRK